MKNSNSGKLYLLVRPTKSNVDNFDHNYDFNAKVIVIGLRVKRSHNFMPRVMRKRLRVDFHNFDDNFAVLANREPSCHFGVIELNWTSWANYASYHKVIVKGLRVNFDNFSLTLTPSN